MATKQIYIFLFFFFVYQINQAQAELAERPTWQVEEPVPMNGRKNILQLNSEDFHKFKNQGQLHSQIYPVTVTGLLPPYEATKNFIEGDLDNPIRKIISKLATRFAKINSFDQVFENLGLHAYPQNTDRGIYQVPYPNNLRPDHRLGFGTIERFGTKGFTFSCAACHSSELFGKTVLGMTNRFPRANEFFFNAKRIVAISDPHMFKAITGASRAEAQLFQEAKSNARRVAVKMPIQLGLDTSLAQVALSLNKRKNDEYASPSGFYQVFPRQDPLLDTEPADSKPAVWWNVKYKNRWLSDGSVISGNPIYTNILWNEIGRGVDLKVLEKWLDENQKIIDELTTAVFASEAPRITDFFPAEMIDLSKAQKGEIIFNNRCAKCHGVYEKAWHQSNFDSLSKAERLATTKVIPIANTIVRDVGTDPYRYKGMQSLEKLNELSISKRNNILIRAQKGYVPPPLVGIWARWPYFHNNSVPDLCSLLTPGPQRPVTYYAREAKNPKIDFDFNCNGYPKTSAGLDADKKSDYFYDSRRKGLSNQGHDEGIFIKDGKELLSADDKINLIQFLQTL